ncbi:MAG TPA: RNA polymerase-associated protein RapA [Sedimenticola thiotaurini]|uniref:RNA polymerase-associated protein RapA n=1 Tax=Sedimenticola thiotaurini TaxID=1543721 RepID=A0A831RM50_9GAMM|nr:RNA polymerase-associated protein RapA [Sedimenticola thiotaurini]
MSTTDFRPGQRWVSDTEPDLGLGTLLKSEGRTVTLLFPASGERRTYALDNSPLTRVRFGPGDRVQDLEGRALWVVSMDETAGRISYRVRSDTGVEETLPEGGLSAFLQFSRPQERLFAGQLDQPEWFDLRLRTLEQRQRLEGSPLLGLGGARTALLPHQLYIAHEVSRRPLPRVLLADEVGLGKTIEAGLILHRLRLSGRVSRALVVVPPPLLNQWLVELLRRFNLRFSLFDGERCQAIESSDQGENPFQSEQLVLTSLDLLTAEPRRTEQALEAGWDLLIVDEAHHLEWSEQGASDAYRAVEALARRIPAVLLLTATPEQLGQAGHFARLRLLDPDRFHDLATFVAEESRFRPIAEAAEQVLAGGILPEQSAGRLADLLNEPEALPLLARLSDPSLDEERRRTAREQLLVLLLDRHGTGRVLFRNTRHRITGFPARELHPCPLDLPDEYQRALAAPDLAPQLRLTPEAIDRGDAAPPWWRFDPRVEWLAASLKRLGDEKVLLIAARRETVQGLEEALRSRHGIHAALFHEGMSILERDRAAAWFADPEEGCRILLCSEIGSEGRNFQFAHHLVLFDLPLDPDLLEQRIGRLDRIGQGETIRIHVPWFEQSAQAVLLRWYHEGLDAFRATCPAGHALLRQLQPALLEQLDEPAADPEALEALIGATRRLRLETNERLRRGRDQLLELNSCREPEASALRRRIEQEQRDHPLAEYLEQLLGRYGVESEFHSAGSLILRPGSGMLQDSFPGLPQEGMTATFDRDIALAHEDRQFLTWEHPLVREGMAMLCDGREGSSSVCGLRHPHLKGGGLLLELLYVIECPAPRRLQVGRFLPPTLIRLLLDAGGEEQDQAFDHTALVSARVPLETATAARVAAVLQPAVRQLLVRAESLAGRQLSPTIDRALEDMAAEYATEIARLHALQRVNPNVTEEEIGALKRQALELEEHLKQARLRLDAIQLWVGL